MREKLKKIDQYKINILQLILFLYILTGIIITALATNKYHGDGRIFLVFSIFFNLLLLIGIRKNANFFDFFIGLFLWMGFWLKLTVRVLFFESKFSESTGAFDYSSDSFDTALIVSIVGAAALISASLLRERFVPKSIVKKFNDRELNQKKSFYSKYRSCFLLIFLISFITIAIVNIQLGIYQKGEITKTVFPYGINGIVKWLILFGFSSFSAILLKIEIDEYEKVTIITIIIIILESFFSNTSLLSRGMILNSGALALGGYILLKKNNLIKININNLIIGSIIFCVLFLISVMIVNDLRGNGSGYARLYLGEIYDKKQEVLEPANDLDHATPLLLNRWVGIEGVMSVSSSNRLSWSLWNDAWSEKYSENTMGFYDLNLIESPYKNTDFTKHHHLSLPGIVAFLFYPGSLVFLFLSMLCIGLIASFIELYVYKLGGNNLILCSLISMVVAYRFASFGYVPNQSYLLFGAIIINVMIINIIGRIICIYKQKVNLY